MRRERCPCRCPCCCPCQCQASGAAARAWAFPLAGAGASWSAPGLRGACPFAGRTPQCSCGRGPSSAAGSGQRGIPRAGPSGSDRRAQEGDSLHECGSVPSKTHRLIVLHKEARGRAVMGNFQELLTVLRVRPQAAPPSSDDALPGVRCGRSGEVRGTSRTWVFVSVSTPHSDLSHPQSTRVAPASACSLLTAKRRR